MKGAFVRGKTRSQWVFKGGSLQVTCVFKSTFQGRGRDFPVFQPTFLYSTTFLVAVTPLVLLYTAAKPSRRHSVLQVTGRAVIHNESSKLSTVSTQYPPPLPAPSKVFTGHCQGGFMYRKVFTGQGLWNNDPRAAHKAFEAQRRYLGCP